MADTAHLAETDLRGNRHSSGNFALLRTAARLGRGVLLILHGSGPGVTGWRNFRGNLACSPSTSAA